MGTVCRDGKPSGSRPQLWSNRSQRWYASVMGPVQGGRAAPRVCDTIHRSREPRRPSRQPSHQAETVDPFHWEPPRRGLCGEYIWARPGGTAGAGWDARVPLDVPFPGIRALVGRCGAGSTPGPHPPSAGDPGISKRFGVGAAGCGLLPNLLRLFPETVVQRNR